MKAKRRRGPRFVRVQPVALGLEVLLYAVDVKGEIWERAPGTSWVRLPAGEGGK